MVAGTNMRANIWRINNLSDNQVGGAITSGTISAANILAILHGEEPEQLVLQQGLETIRIFKMLVIPGTLDIQERDEVEIISPDSIYYQKRFRVLGVRYSSHGLKDPRNYVLLHVTRDVRAHARQ